MNPLHNPPSLFIQELALRFLSEKIADAVHRAYMQPGSGGQHASAIDAIHEALSDTPLIDAAADLLAALKDEISEVAALAGPCQVPLIPRCVCQKCRRERSLAAIKKATEAREC